MELLRNALVQNAGHRPCIDQEVQILDISD